MIHQSPGIWLFHDLLSPTESRNIVETAGPFVSQFLYYPNWKLTQPTTTLTEWPTIGKLSKWPACSSLQYTLFTKKRQLMHPAGRLLHMGIPFPVVVTYRVHNIQLMLLHHPVSGQQEEGISPWAEIAREIAKAVKKVFKLTRRTK